MRFCFLSIFLITILLSSADAQNNGRIYTDSILHELKQSPNDTAKVEMYQILASEYNDIDLDSAIYYGELSLQLSKKLKLHDLEYGSYLNLGLTHLINVENDTALQYFNKALNAYKKTKDSVQIASALFWIAEVHNANGDIAKSLELNFEALEVFERHNEREQLITSYVTIGALYMYVEEYDKAKRFYKKALELSKQLGDKMQYGDVLTYISELFLTEEKTDSALTFAQDARKIFQEVKNDFFVAVASDLIGEIYIVRKDYVEALSSFLISKEIYATVNDRRVIATNLSQIASVYLSATEDDEYKTTDERLIPTSKSANYRLAIKNLEHTKEIFINDLDREQELGDVYYDLSVAYEGVGNVSNALTLLKRHMELKDSLDSENQGKQVAKLDANRAISLKNKELELQKLLIAKKRNERGFLIGGIALLFLVIGIIFYNYRERGKTNKLLSEEKHKSEELLLNILPEEVANELKEKGFADATHFDEVTVLFTDFVNFSEASERMGSQELVNELHGCFRAFDDIMGKYGIEKIKTIGDAYLAVCGLPTADKHHAQKVVNAAQDIRSFMLHRREQLGDKTFEVRIGVHSGEVVAGIVGVKKFAYDIWGDTVNTAARMEQNSEAGKINISQTTYELVQDKFTCTYRGEIEAKGKGMLKMYFVDEQM